MDPWSESVIAALGAVRSQVLHITAAGGDEAGLHFGSGLALDHYHVVTTAQVIPFGVSDITLIAHDRRSYDAEVVSRDPLYFLVVLRARRRLELERKRWGNSDHLKAGQFAIAVGNPFGTDHTVTLGLVSAPDRTIYRPERFPVDGLIVTDAALHQGNAGGALADLDGQVVGLNGVSWTPGIGFAVQANTVARIGAQILEYGQATHPWLGFSGHPESIEPTVVELLSLPIAEGLLVTHTTPGGPGERAGIRPMDLVVRVKDKPAISVGQVRKALAAGRPGDATPLTVFRGGDLMELQMQVEQMPWLFAR